MFAFQKVGFNPDFLCLSKGLTGGTLPLSLTITSQEIFDSFLSSDSNKMFFHGHSFTGNAISCAAACANLKIFQQTNVVSQIHEIEEAHRSAIRKISEKLPLRDTRILGTMGAIELDGECGYGSSLSNEISSRCLNKGVFLRPLGNVIYLMPPYCTKKEGVEFAWEVISSVIE